MMKRFINGALIALGILAVSHGAANAQATQPYPNRPVKIVTYFSAGSGPDVVIRIVADNLSKMWQQAVVVENKPGANGIIAIDALKNSPPDGYTLGFTDGAVLTINPHLYPSMKLRAEVDLTPISLCFNTPFYLIVPANSSIKSVPDLIAQAKANPGKIFYGSPTGIGNPGHLGMEVFKAETGTNMVVVPYKVSGPMLTDLATGSLQVAWASMGSARAMLQTGAIVPIAVGSRKRQPAKPEVPTLKEAGGPPLLDVDSWAALFGPKDMPKDLLAKITADMTQVLTLPEVTKRIVDLGNEPKTGNGDRVAELIRIDYARYGKVIKDLNIKME
jgi:tripartite-type tricarboxylate transporter receptor subunit TctC